MGIIPIVVVVAAVVLVTRDEHAGRLALQALQPMVRAAADAAAVLVTRPLPMLTRAAVALAALLAVAGGWYRRSGWPRWMLLAAAAAVLAQLALLHRHVALGSVGYVVAFGLVAVARWQVRRHRAGDPLDEPAGPITVAEVLGVCVVLAAAVVLRLYALNRVPGVFEGELSPYMVGAASWRGMLLANAGVDGPWAPLGLLYYLPIRLGIALVGPTVLAVRLGSALVALVTIAVAWLLAREVAGRWAGLTAAVLLALDPLQIGWGRSDIHPHGATAWIGLLLCWVLIRLRREPRWPTAAGAALLMGLSWHQYPSGQLVVALPIVTVLGWWLLDRDARRELRWSSLWLVAGLGLWLAGGPLTTWAATGRIEGLGAYLARLGPRVAGADQAAPESLAQLAVHLVGNAGDLVRGLFIAVPHLFHQTIIPAVPGLDVRSLPWLTLVLAFIGLAVLVTSWRRPAALPLLVLVVCGAAPSVLARIAYVKRAAVMYPALIVIAGIGAATVAIELAPLLKAWWSRAAVGGLLLVLVAGWFVIALNLWFSGDRYPYGHPDEEVLAAAVAAALEPGTIVIGAFTDHYLIGKLTYLLLDDLQAVAPVAWAPVYTLEGLPAELVTAPASAAADIARRSWTHRWSALGRKPRRVRDAVAWQRVVYLIQRGPETDQLVAEVEARCGRRWRRFEVGPNRNLLDLMVCPLPPSNQ